MDAAIWVQDLKEAVYISHWAKIFGNGMDSTILRPAMSKIVGYTWLVNLGMEIGLTDGKSFN